MGRGKERLSLVGAILLGLLVCLLLVVHRVGQALSSLDLLLSKAPFFGVLVKWIARRARGGTLVLLVAAGVLGLLLVASSVPILTLLIAVGIGAAAGGCLRFLIGRLLSPLAAAKVAKEVYDEIVKNQGP